MWLIKESDIHGVGVFAAEDIPSDTKVACVATAKYTNIGDTAKLQMITYDITEFGSKVNHQRECNVELRLVPGEDYWLYSTKDIEKGSELVLNYKGLPQYFSRTIKGFVEKNNQKKHHDTPDN